MTKSLTYALEETEWRRNTQREHNEKHGITPTSVKKAVSDALQESIQSQKQEYAEGMSEFETEADIPKKITQLHKQMVKAAENLEFETAANLRDQIKHLENLQLGLITPRAFKARKRKKKS